MKKLALFLAFFLVLSSVVYAHGGRTDGSGGHYDRSDGSYHYHHGYSEHSHYDMDGDGDEDCPYEFDDKTDHNSTSVASDDILEAMKSQFFRAVVYSIIGTLVIVYISGSVVACDEKTERLIAKISAVVLFVGLYIWLICEQVM